MKICTGCGATYPATVTYFHRHKPSIDGLKPRCKRCQCDAQTTRTHALSLKERRARWARYKVDRNKANEANRRWTKRNPTHSVEWARRNPERRKAIRNRHYLKVQKTSPQWRLSRQFAKRMRGAIHGKGGESWEAFVGYTRRDLFEHLQRLFLPGMSWDNYGEWEVDHVRPVASFQFASRHDDHFRMCWSLSNLQPLWAADNRRKAARWAS